MSEARIVDLECQVQGLKAGIRKLQAECERHRVRERYLNADNDRLWQALETIRQSLQERHQSCEALVRGLLCKPATPSEDV